ncbi:unnamed protein product [Scytosiphon promiscuus]
MHALIRLGARVDATDGSGITALHLAVSQNQPAAVACLVRAGADIDVQDSTGLTALYVATGILHNSTIAERLVQAGANIHIQGKNGYTPALVAAVKGKASLVMCMLRHGSKPPPDIASLYVSHHNLWNKTNRLLEMLIGKIWEPSPSRTINGSDGGSGDSECRHLKDFPLHKAIITGDLDGLADLLRKGEDPNASGPSGRPALQEAARANSVPMVHALLAAGAALDTEEPQYGSTALHVSAMEGHVEVAKVLLEAGAAASPPTGGNPKSPSSSTTTAAGITPCTSPATRVGDSGGATSSRLAAAPIDGKASSSPSAAVIEAQDNTGMRPLHVAAVTGSVRVVEALLRAGASIDSRDKNGRTPLLYAAQANEAGVVEILLKAGALPDLRDSNGHTALHRAVLMPAWDALEALVATGASAGSGGEKGHTPLHSACEKGERGTVEALLRAGAVAGHCWNDSMESPLMVACKAGNRNAVELLLPRLSVRQINMRDRTYAMDRGGETPLVATVWYSRDNESETIGIVEALLRAGADPSRWTSNGMTPLAAVILGKNTKANPTLGPPLVRTLAGAGADVNGVSSFNGFAPLHYACWEGAGRQLVEALLDAGADPQGPCAGMKFMTPLQLAGTSGNAEAVTALLGRLEDGALDAVGDSPSRDTALACAVRHGRTEVCRLLLELGADMDLLSRPSRGPRARAGDTARAMSLVETAAQFGHLDTMNLLIQAKILKDTSAGAHGAPGVG